MTLERGPHTGQSVWGPRRFPLRGLTSDLVNGLWGHWVRAGVVVLVAVASAGCAAGGHAASRPVKIPTFATTTPPESYVPPPAAMPSDCTDMLSFEDAARMLDHPLQGVVHTLIDIPNPKINRLSRIECRYGVQPTAWASGTAPLEIGGALYTDPASAQERGKTTVDDARTQNAAVNDVQVGPDHAVVLVKPDGRELVLSKGKATLTVSIGNGLVPDNKIGTVLTTIAAKMINLIPQ